HFGELSPSGDLLAFLSPLVDMNATLYVGDLRTGDVQTLAHGVGTPHWGPQGNRIFFGSAREGLPDLWALDVDPQSGRPLGKARRLTSALGLDEFAAGPGGRKFVAVRAKSQSRLWLFPTEPERLTDLTAGRSLTSEGFIDFGPSWTPDGRGILFASNRRGTDS